ncbi:N-acetylmuramoyl-L-alanine amidase family protein [Helicobacter gastrocanis]|nr:N-acetylmuramoyl-L-alanine amidase [Helicobacter sp. NHP19-003]
MDVVPFGVSSLRITFNQPINHRVVKETRLSHFKTLLQVKAQLLLPPRRYRFANKTSIKITHRKYAQIWIAWNKNTTYSYKIAHEHLYILIQTHPLVRQNIRALEPNPKELKQFKVVIDPGHGGHDCGALGVNHVCEKRIVLAVAKDLQQELQKQGYKVYMTRKKDVYISLKARTEFANDKNADLFISIHANSIPKNATTNPEGIETYFLSTARSERARKVAEQENQDDVKVMDYFSKLSFLNSLNSQRLIISNKLAIDVQFGILSKLRQHYKGVVDGGVREGPFWVLAGALMPSILIEIGYNSNPKESKRIQDKRYEQWLAKGIADGVQSFISKNY